MNTKEKNIKYLDTEVLDCLIYEIYLDDILKTNLMKLIKPFTLKIEKILIENKIELLEKIVRDIELDITISEEVKKIKQYEIVKRVESNL